MTEDAAVEAQNAISGGAKSVRKSNHSTSKIAGYEVIRKSLKLCATDRRTMASREFEAICRELFTDLGGRGRCSAAQIIMVNMIARECLLLELTDGYMANQGIAFDRRRKRLHRMVSDRNALADTLAGHLKILGVKRGRQP